MTRTFTSGVDVIEDLTDEESERFWEALADT